MRKLITTIADADAHKGLPQASTPIWVVFGLAMGPTIALGLARFAYALLLPAMRDDLGWSFSQAGGMNTANATGYLAGALMATPLGRRLGDRSAFFIGLFLTTVAVGLSAMSAEYGILLVLRFAAGFMGAVAFVTGAGLTAVVASGGPVSRSAKVLGIYFAGGGIGITASALVVPPLLASYGWRSGWLVMGALCLAATVFAWASVFKIPLPVAAPSAQLSKGWSPRFLMPTLIAYFLYGAGYSAYSTFIIAYLRSDLGFTVGPIAVFWAILGLSAVAAVFVWGPILGKLSRGWGIFATITGVTIGATLPLLFRNVTGAYLSAVVFGGCFLAVIAAVTSFARQAARPHAWTAAIATLTTTFGMGQCIGPVISGALSEGPSGISEGLWVSVGILLASALLASLQRAPEAAA